MDDAELHFTARDRELLSMCMDKCAQAGADGAAKGTKAALEGIFGGGGGGGGGGLDMAKLLGGAGGNLLALPGGVRGGVRGGGGADGGGSGIIHKYNSAHIEQKDDLEEYIKQEAKEGGSGVCKINTNKTKFGITKGYFMTNTDEGFAALELMHETAQGEMYGGRSVCLGESGKWELVQDDKKFYWYDRKAFIQIVADPKANAKEAGITLLEPGEWEAWNDKVEKEEQHEQDPQPSPPPKKQKAGPKEDTAKKHAYLRELD